MANLGTQSLVLTADASPLVNNIKDASNKSKKELETLRQKADKASGELFKKIVAGNIVGNIGGKALEEIGTAIFNNLTKQGEFNRMIEKSNELAKEQVKILDRQIAKRQELIDATVNPLEKQKLIAKEIESIEALRTQALAKQERIRKVLTGLENGNADSLQLQAGGMLEKSLEFVRGKLDDATSAVEKFNDKLAELNEMKLRIETPANNPALIGEINSLVDSLELQIATKGMSATEASIEALRRKGATEAMLDRAKELAQQIDADKQAFKYQDISAMTRGSTEANSIVNKFKMESMFKGEQGKPVEEKQLDELKKIPPAIDKVTKVVNKWHPLVLEAW